MNGELLQACRLVAAVKSALRGHGALNFERLPYEREITFDLSAVIPGRADAENETVWFETLRAAGLCSAALAACDAADRILQGLSNSSQAAIRCQFKDGTAVRFDPTWQFDRETGSWQTHYAAVPDPDGANETPVDNTAALRSALSAIDALALDIGCDAFAHRFAPAQRALAGAQLPTSLCVPSSLPTESARLFAAAQLGDVFGAMGSWNDSPSCMAHEKGRDGEYDACSAALFRELRAAIRFAVNGW